MPQFNRSIEIIIDNKNNQIIIPNTFKIMGTINKTEQKESNTCSIQIYNLNDTTINNINYDSLVTVKAGYLDGSGMEVIFKGDVKNYSTNYDRNSGNIITSLELLDGHSSTRKNKISISYGSGVRINTLLKQAADKLGLPVKNLPNLSSSDNKTFNNGFSFTGLVSDLLDILTNDSNTRWSVQNNELKVYDKNGSDLSFAIDIKSSTGMIGSPIKIKVERNNNIKNDGYKVISFLQPLAEPGGRIQLTAKRVNTSIFKIVSVNHSIDNKDGNFLSTIEAVQ